MTETTKHDYEMARELAQALCDTLKISCTVSKPRGVVRDNDWPCIEYDLAFTCAGRTFETQYRLGIGHVKVTTQGTTSLIFTPNEEHLFFAWQRKPHAAFLDKELQARVAAKLASVQKVSPAPSEVLAMVCNDGLSAHNSSWEQWAGDFGSDPDSIKAKAVYDECTALYWKLASFIGVKNVEQLAELAQRF